MAMTMNDYREQVKADLLAYTREAWEYNNEVTADQIMDDAFIEDSVTGNASGSYTFSAYEAQQNVSGVIWEAEVLEIFREFGGDHIPLEAGAEYIDVSIRCFIVNEFTSDVEELLNELNENVEVRK